jgi:hypothetical protein
LASSTSVVFSGRRQRDGRADRHARAADRVVQQLVVPAGDVGQQAQAIAVREQEDQVADHGREAERVGDRARGPAPHLDVDRGAEQDGLETRLGERRGGTPELVAPTARARSPRVRAR